MKSRLHRRRGLWQAELFSPKDFVRRAVVIGLAFATAHVCGLRDLTSIVTGTTGAAEMSRTAAGVLGITYIIFYLAFLLLVPVFLLAATLLTSWKRLSLRSGIHFKAASMKQCSTWADICSTSNSRATREPSSAKP